MSYKEEDPTKKETNPTNKEDDFSKYESKKVRLTINRLRKRSNAILRRSQMRKKGQSPSIRRRFSYPYLSSRHHQVPPYLS